MSNKIVDNLRACFLGSSSIGDGTDIVMGRPDEEAPPEVSSGQLERIVASLEEQILFGRLHPRERLVEADLAARFGVNRHVVRQALANLDAMGLVERVRNRGAIVRDFSARDAEDIYVVRELLELAAAARLPLPASPQVIERLTTLQEQHDRGVEDGDLRRVFRLNIEFHRLLYSTCDNRFLLEAIELYAYKSHAIRSYPMTRRDYLSEKQSEHWGMIEALRSGERERLVEFCRRHIERAKNAYIEAYTRRYGWYRPFNGAAPERDDQRGSGGE
jgi:DNA-binding GntR family transcriptional regulator